MPSTIVSPKDHRDAVVRITIPRFGAMRPEAVKHAASYLRMKAEDLEKNGNAGWDPKRPATFRLYVGSLKNWLTDVP